MGVFADLVEDAKQRGLPFGEDIIRAAITIYTCRYAYQKSLSKVRERFNLSGEPEGEVTAEQKNTPVFRSSALMRRLKPENRRERMKMRPNPQIVSPVHNDSRPQKSSAPFWVVFRGKAWVLRLRWKNRAQPV